MSHLWNKFHIQQETIEYPLYIFCKSLPLNGLQTWHDHQKRSRPMLASGNRLAGRQHTSPSLWQTPDKQSSVPLVSTAAWSRFQNELPEAKTQSDLLRWYGIPCNIYKDERNLKSDYTISKISKSTAFAPKNSFIKWTREMKVKQMQGSNLQPADC